MLCGLLIQAGIGVAAANGDLEPTSPFDSGAPEIGTVLETAQRAAAAQPAPTDPKGISAPAALQAQADRLQDLKQEFQRWVETERSARSKVETAQWRVDREKRKGSDILGGDKYYIDAASAHHDAVLEWKLALVGYYDVMEKFQRYLVGCYTSAHRLIPAGFGQSLNREQAICAGLRVAVKHLEDARSSLKSNYETVGFGFRKGRERRKEDLLVYYGTHHLVAGVIAQLTDESLIGLQILLADKPQVCL